MNDTRKLQQERREKINKHKREIISKISPKERRMFGVVTQFAAELVWTYVDGLCDALASSKEDYKKNAASSVNYAVHSLLSVIKYLSTKTSSI